MSTRGSAGAGRRRAGVQLWARSVPRSFLAAVAVVCAAAVSTAPAAHAAPLRVLLLGDSITYGSTSGPVGTPGGYRGMLDVLLARAGVEHRFVGTGTANSTPALDRRHQAHHDGHPGYRIDQVAAGLTGAVSHAAPDVTVIHLGTNDVMQRYDPARRFPTPDGRADLTDAGQRAAFVADLAARLAALADRVAVLRPRSAVVLSTIVPVGIAPYDVAVADYAAAVARVVARERAAGVRIVLADVWGAFTGGGPRPSPGLLSPDGVHPSAAGYAVMAGVYRDAVTAVPPVWRGAPRPRYGSPHRRPTARSAGAATR